MRRLRVSGRIGGRRFGRAPSSLGAISSYKGFVTDDIYLNLNASIGGTHSRGVFAKREISFDREILSCPAFASYVGDESLRDQVLEVTRDVLKRLVEGGPDATFIEQRLMTLMAGGKPYFLREEDVWSFLESVPGALRFVRDGRISTYDFQKFPLLLEFNRFDVTYRGRSGICIVPEASYFNHQCSPNVELSVKHDPVKGFIVSGRTLRPIRAGEELFINYMPGNNLPLSRLATAMRERWGFECVCVRCKARLVAATIVLVVFGFFPLTITMRYLISSRMERNRASSIRV